MPIGGLRDSCISLGSVGEIVQYLGEKLQLVWILKSEDRELTRLAIGIGGRILRPPTR